LAAAKRVVDQRTRLDDWAEAVTEAAGDDVCLDPTQKLLMLLTKKPMLSGRQAARLLNNYMEECLFDPVGVVAGASFLDVCKMQEAEVRGR